MTPAADGSWLQTLQSLLHYYLPPLEASSYTVAGCLGAMALGFVMAFRSGKLAQGLVCVVGLMVGAYAAYSASLFLGTPGPISAAVGGVVLAAVAYRTYRWWLGAGSVVALVAVVLGYQLVVHGDLSRLLPNGEAGASGPAESTAITLASPAEQLKNLYPQQTRQLTEIATQLTGQMKEWGPRGWLLPAAGLGLGLLLALAALRLITVMWIALVGASLAVGGATGLLLIYRPSLQPDVIARPDVLIGAIGGVWILGLISQAKAARFGGGGGGEGQNGKRIVE